MQSELERKIFELLTHGYPAPFARVHSLAKQIADLITQEPAALSDKQAGEVKDAHETVQKLCDMHGTLLRILDEKVGFKVFMANEVSILASLLLDAATKLDRVNRSALVDVPAVEPVADDLIGYVLRYGGMCRDCADMDGVCQSGQPCDNDQRRAVVKHTIAALAYGIKYGFIANPFTSPPLSREGEDSAEVDRLTRPIVGIEHRTAQEVFDIMADRIRFAATRSGSATTQKGCAE